MVRVSAMFIAGCMVLIAASLGIVAYLRIGLTGAESALIALGVLTALAVYNAVVARLRDRAEASGQISALSRNSGDLARQIGEVGLRLNAMDKKIEQVLERSLAAAEPLAIEVEELSGLVRELADSVAAHEVALGGDRAKSHGNENTVVASAPVAAIPGDAGVAPMAAPSTPPAAPSVAAPSMEGASTKGASVGGASADNASTAVTAPAAPPATPPAAAEPPIAAFNGLDRDGIIATIRTAVESGKIDVYLQPLVMLPQRKVRFYEALSRLKAENGDVVAAANFLRYSEAGSLMPKLDHLMARRCVQVVRRLLLKNRDIGVFCNLSSATLTDAAFPQFLEYLEANRAIAASLVLEFTQSAVRAMGPIEHESLAALSERGFRFSMDNLSDLRVEPRELSERGFRFIKTSAALLLNRVGSVSTDIHPADLSDLLARFGIDLVADRIENENTVVDLLDYDVRFGQGFLFAPPRPVRPEALGGAISETDQGRGKTSPAEPPDGASPLAPAAIAASQSAVGDGRKPLAQLLRAGAARS